MSIEKKGPKHLDKKPDNVVPFPNRQGGFDEVAKNLREELWAVVENEAELAITDEEIEEEKRDLLANEHKVEDLKDILEASERLSGIIELRDRDTIIHYLAAAEAYKELTEEEKKEE